MPGPIDYVRPKIEFDSTLADSLASMPTTLAYEPPATLDGMVARGAPPLGHRSPFVGYSRSLTLNGGILIEYRELLDGPFYMALRVLAWTSAVGLSGWYSFSLINSGWLAFWTAWTLILLATWIVFRKLGQMHTIEIHPDYMIIDDRYTFYADHIGPNWPTLQRAANATDDDHLVIAGILGTRWVEYTTVTRYDPADRTAEVLSADLRAAFEQLWGRREAIYPVDSF